MKLLLLLETLTLAAGTSSKMDFMPLGSVRTDPVTNPTCLSGHVHTYYGANASLRPETNYADMRAATGNSGNVEENKSLYWHPSIYRFDPVSSLYHLVDIYFASAYYVWKTGETKAFPDGFQMIARQSSGPKARVFFDCNGPSVCEQADCTPAASQNCSPGDCLPTTQCSELEIKIVFPGCWDGTSLTSGDFMSHVAYTVGDWGSLPLDDRQDPAVNNACPTTHPVRIPEVQMYFRVKGYLGGHHVFSDGTQELHADYFSGWEEAALQEVLNECQNDSEAASPDAWCENHLTFRDLPKQKGDERIVRLLAGLQPNPPLALQQTVSTEKITAISALPGGDCSTLVPIPAPTAAPPPAMTCTDCNMQDANGLSFALCFGADGCMAFNTAQGAWVGAYEACTTLDAYQCKPCFPASPSPCGVNPLSSTPAVSPPSTGSCSTDADCPGDTCYCEPIENSNLDRRLLFGGSFLNAFFLKEEDAPRFESESRGMISGAGSRCECQ